MNYQWKNATITETCIALYVAPNTGKGIYKNRPYHGLALNDSNSVKDYIFDDGRIMHTAGNSLYYIPKVASYNVKSQVDVTSLILMQRLKSSRSH